ncbi:MAG: hypothetical protein V3V00_09535 [Saprospiraceae bacterium]
MRKTILGLLMILIGATMAFGQGEKDLKNASKALAKYNKDPFSNAAELEKAQSLLMSAFEDEEVLNSAKSWVTRGDIFKSLAESQTNSKLLNPEYEIGEKMAAQMAAEYYLKANEMAKTADSKTAKKVNKSVVSGLKKVEGQLNNYGILLYQENDYAGSQKHFQTELTIYDLLRAKGESSRLDDETLHDEKEYFVGIAASLAENYDVAIPFLAKQLEKGTDESLLYQFLYEAYLKSGMDDKATETLQAGRAKFPDDANLLFSEINYFLKRGELDKMTANLESALAKEPNNVSVITTLGQVYDQLSIAADAEGDNAKSLENYNKAANYYGDALNKNADNFDLNYSMGALHYNRAATFTDDLNKLSDDFTSTGVKKYDAIKAEMASYFDKALPYFLKADSINGKDKNTLIALKEILARKDDFAGSDGYKKRLESLD